MSANFPTFGGADRWKPKKKRILIVEDNHLDSALFGALLESQGHEVLKAGNASDGLKLAREDHPDLIIMDVRLPGMSGFEATRTLKGDDATRDIPVIVTSAYGPYADQDELRECGCDAYMPTPVEIAGFVDLVHSFLSRPQAKKRA
jgi:two-component system, cell cycle response regulator DivK